MPTPEYFAAERKRNAERTDRETFWISAALVILGLVLWACGGADAVI